MLYNFMEVTLFFSEITHFLTPASKRQYCLDVETQFNNITDTVFLLNIITMLQQFKNVATKLQS